MLKAKGTVHVRLMMALSFLTVVLHTWNQNVVVTANHFHFDLIPSSTTAHGRRRLSETGDFPEGWFHPSVRAVYATLHPSPTSLNASAVTDDDDDDDSEYHDFLKHRHLSRYERYLRTSLGWDLQSTVTAAKNTTRHRTLQKLRGGGGQFNDYQGIPLSQGYGTHYVHIWIGGPIPQRQSVIVDTGSHFTAFPCQGCRNCGQELHTDPYFDPSKSETFEYLKGCEECPNECRTNKNHVLASNINSSSSGHVLPKYYCPLSQSYTEGSSWKGILAKDGLYCGGSDILEAADPVDRQFSIPFLFGCLQESTGLFATQLANGIMGLSAHELTLPKQIYNTGLLEYNVFALCFRKELKTSKRGVTAGSMTLGGVSSALDTTPMIYAKNVASFGWFTVHVRRMYMASSSTMSSILFDTVESTKNIHRLNLDETLVNAGKGVIVDSGTTDSYLSEHLFPAFAKVWKEITESEYTDGPQLLTQAQVAKLPTLLIQCEAADVGVFPSNQPVLVGQAGMLDPRHPTDFLWAIPATHYMEYSPTLKMYTSRLYFTEAQGGVFGANAMQGHNVVFDWQHGRIGFSQSTCDYDLLAGQKKRQKRHVKDGDSNGPHGLTGDSFSLFGTGCILEDSPVLTQPCQVDASVCHASDQPDNVSVLGMETWTWIVDATGRDSDSCQEVLTEWTLRHNLDLDPSIVDCTGDGICTEQRPCEIPCLQAMSNEKTKASFGEHSSSSQPDLADQTVTPVYPNEDPQSKCGESYWSACDFSCKQSRLSSRMSTKGTTQSSTQDTCVEVARETRSCHVDACGRSDPCLVPFLVHSSLVLEGSIQYDDETFRREFTKVAHLVDFSSTKAKRYLFQEGDVDVLVVRPWYDDDDDEKWEEGKDSNRRITSDGQHALGIQLILQVSIFNPRAQKTEQIHTHRSLLQEIGVLWTNMTQPFREPPSQSTCDLSDMYPLAKDAVELAYGVLENDNFGPRLIKDLAWYHRARVLSSWTTSTQVIDDTSNAVGSITVTSSVFIFRVFYEASLMFVFVSLLSFLVQMVVKYCRYRSTVRLNQCHWRCCSRKRKSYGYHVLEKDDDDDNSLNAKVLGTPREPTRVVEMELPAVRLYSEIDRQRSNSTATKRKATLFPPPFQ
jgi:hypothetical protein